MGKKDSPADRQELGAYGRRSWLSDDDPDQGQTSAAPFNPFASPAAPEAPPVPMARIEPDAPARVSWPMPPSLVAPSPAPVAPVPLPPVARVEPTPARIEPPAVAPEIAEPSGQGWAEPVEADPVVFAPGTVEAEQELVEPDEPPAGAAPTAPAPLPPPPTSSGLRIPIPQGRKRMPKGPKPVWPWDEASAPPAPLEPDGPLRTDAERPDLAEAARGPRGRRFAPRWAGRRPYAEEADVGPDPASDAKWWTSAAPHPSDAVAVPASPSPVTRQAGDRIVSEGAWSVTDVGTSVSVSGANVSGVQWLVMLVVAVPAILILGSGAFPLFFVAFGVLAVVINIANGSRSGRAFLRADERGLHLRRSPFGGGVVLVPWDDIAGLESRVGRGPQWPKPETWFVVTRGGERIQVLALTSRQSLSPYRALRHIMVGVGLFPMRFGRPALPIDGVPGPTPAGQLPPPPSRAGNENVF